MKMKLTDFRNHPGLNELRKKLSQELVQDIPPIIVRLRKGIEIQNLEDEGFSISSDGSGLFYEGQRVLLFLKEQVRFDDNPGYVNKFHIAFCMTLQGFKKKKKFNRYVAAKNNTGEFSVNMEYYTSSSERRFRNCYKRRDDEIHKLGVCQNCLRVMRQKYPNDRKLWEPNSFNLEEYFTKYDTEHIHTPRYTEVNAPKNVYTDDWKEISERIRQSANYLCSECGRDYSLNKGYLDVHHVNGIRGDNRIENLKVLCFECHSKQDGHSHMRYSSTVRRGKMQ